jgi:hypothetical protein
LNRFAESYRDPTPAAFAASLRTIIRAVRRHVSTELAAALEGSAANTAKIAKAEAAIAFWGAVDKSLNLPVLISFLMTVERLGREGALQPTKLVHDEQGAYQDAYKKVFTHFRRDASGKVVWPNGAVLYAALKHIPQFEIATSHSQPLIQAADVLAGTVNYLLRQAALNIKASPIDMALSRMVVHAMLTSSPRTTWMVASNSLLRAIGRTYVAPAMKHRGSASQIQPAAHSEGEAPLLPGSPGATTAQGQLAPPRRYDFRPPFYGVVGTHHPGLMVLHEDGRNAAVVLFTRRQQANWLRTAHKWSEPQTVMRFRSARELVQLVAMLEAVQPYTNRLVIDGKHHLDLRATVAGLRQSLVRVFRLTATGLVRTVLTRHRIRGERVLSMLAADGTYVAVRHQSGRLYRGKTRAAVIAALKRGGK